MATAIHAGTELRPEIDDLLILDRGSKRREEDPYTDRLVDVGSTRVVVSRSRFEVDLNRPRDRAVYQKPEDAWGLEMWAAAPDPDVVERSLEVYDAFYAAMAERLDELVADGPIVVLDLHSYNHRRGGPDSMPAAVEDNPEINIGTGPLDRRRWSAVVDVAIEELSATNVGGQPVDVRENVKFTGGHFSRWIAERYPTTAAVLAIEYKKTFMDEWTDDLDTGHLSELHGGLKRAADAIIDVLDR